MTRDPIAGGLTLAASLLSFAAGLWMATDLSAPAPAYQEDAPADRSDFRDCAGYQCARSPADCRQGEEFYYSGRCSSKDYIVCEYGDGQWVVMKAQDLTVEQCKRLQEAYYVGPEKGEK